MELTQPKLSEQDFQKLSSVVYDWVGIKLPKTKQLMVEGRLRKRLKSLNINTYQDYTEFVLSDDGKDEFNHFIDAITTNKTDFFREPRHFDFLTDKLLPELTQQGIGISRPLRIWSAGCSSGEEPYTLAMVLEEWQRKNRKIDYAILATDISTRVLKKAKAAVYSEASVAPISLELRKRYLLRGKDAQQGLVKIAPEIRSQVSFGVLNLKQSYFGLQQLMDIIFCRNVIIYFDQPTEEAIIQRFCANLRPKGHLFLGHSESINGLNVPLVTVASTIYQNQ